MSKDFWTRDDEASGEGMDISIRKDAKKKPAAVVIKFAGSTIEISAETFEKVMQEYLVARAGAK